MAVTFASRPLPEIPPQARLGDRPVVAMSPGSLGSKAALAAAQARAGAQEPDSTSLAVAGERRKRRSTARQPGKGPRSRVGGAILLILAAAVIAAVLIVLVTSGSSSKHSATPAQSASTPPTHTGASATASQTKTSSTTPPTRIVAQINLNPPTATSRARGIADIVTQGSTTAVAIEAQGLAANSTHPPNAYAVWLYNTPTDSDRLGFVNPGVTSTGTLQTAGALPANASRYRRLIVTLEKVADPRIPGPIVLEGTLTGV